MTCKFRAQGKTCALEEYHDNLVHCDESGFRFIDEKWPNKSGNGPDGYPMNNKAFDEAAARVIARSENDAKQAHEFLRKLGNALREK